MTQQTALHGDVDADMFSARLTLLMGRFIPGTEAISGLRRLSGGATQETWSLDAVGAEGSRPLILRRMPSSGRTVDGAVGIENEARIIRSCAQAGLPVPTVLGIIEPSDGLGRGFVMERIAGETIPRKLFKEARFDAVRPHLARNLGEILARIHAVDTSKIAGLPMRTAEDRLAEDAERLERYAIANPVLTLALKWLGRHVPAQGKRLALVHGDFRNGNLMVQPEGVAAVLDWELAHLGDPMEDLGWLCMNSWRFGRTQYPAGGFGSREELYAGYRDAGGHDIDVDAVKFWEVYGSLRWAIGCASMIEVFASGRERDPERVAIAHRVSEACADILSHIAPRRG